MRMPAQVKPDHNPGDETTLTSSSLGDTLKAYTYIHRYGRKENSSTIWVPTPSLSMCCKVGPFTAHGYWNSWQATPTPLKWHVLGRGRTIAFAKHPQSQISCSRHCFAAMTTQRALTTRCLRNRTRRIFSSRRCTSQTRAPHTRWTGCSKPNRWHPVDPVIAIYTGSRPYHRSTDFDHSKRLQRFPIRKSARLLHWVVPDNQPVWNIHQLTHD